MRRRFDTTLRQRGSSHPVATTRQRPRWPSARPRRGVVVIRRRDVPHQRLGVYAQSGRSHSRTRLSSSGRRRTPRDAPRESCSRLSSRAARGAARARSARAPSPRTPTTPRRRQTVRTTAAARGHGCGQPPRSESSGARARANSPGARRGNHPAFRPAGGGAGRPLELPLPPLPPPPPPASVSPVEKEMFCRVLRANASAQPAGGPRRARRSRRRCGEGGHGRAGAV